MLVYVDDVLHIAENPEEGMREISRVYRLKDGVGPPGRYLDGNVQKFQLQNGSVACSLSCHDYLKSAIQNINKGLEEHHVALKNFGTGSRP